MDLQPRGLLLVVILYPYRHDERNNPLTEATVTKKMLVIVPSRGRPQNVERLIQAFKDTHASADLLIAIDKDDKHVVDYIDVISGTSAKVRIEERRRLNGTLNFWANHYANEYDYLAFFGDDHAPRTTLWDQWVLKEFDRIGSGFIYGDDMIQHANLPTAVFVSSDIVKALGYMAPPCLTHFRLDDYWRDLGNAVGRLSYLPDVVIQHIHPLANPELEDAMYLESWGFDQADADAYTLFKLDGGFDADVYKLHKLLNEGAIA